MAGNSLLFSNQCNTIYFKPFNSVWEPVTHKEAYDKVMSMLEGATSLPQVDLEDWINTRHLQGITVQELRAEFE